MLITDKLRWRKLPYTILGFVQGPIRYESNSDDSFYADQQGLIYLEDTFTFQELEYTISPIQKRSRFGFLIQWPLAFHFWIAFKLQKEWEPGSERGIFLRLAWARWDVDDKLPYPWITWKIGFGSTHLGTRWD